MAARPTRWADDVVSQDFGAAPSAPSAPSAPQTGRADAMGFAVCPLALARETPSAARRFTRSTLHGWAMHTCVDDAVAAVSELVTNALRHGTHTLEVPGVAASPRPWAPGRLSSASRSVQPVLLSLVRRGKTVLCAVSDPGAEVPLVRSPERFAESGRGLQVVASLSSAWGWTVPDHYGKAVWAMFSTSPGEYPPGSQTSPHTVDPRTDPARETDRPEDEDWDPLTRLLLLMEILSQPAWLEKLGSGPEVGGTQR